MFKKIRGILEKINNFIDDSFYGDYHNWILWYPIIFGLGILSYFRFEYFNSIALYSLIIILCIIAILFYKNKKLLLLLSVIITFLIGYIRTAVYTNNLRSPTIKYRMGYAKVYGTIEDFTYYQRNFRERKRILVKVDKIEKVKELEKDERERNKYTSYYTKDGLMHNPPKYIRININNKKYQPKFGDYVEVGANLIPIPKQAFPGSYNINRVFYYEQIGGIGYNGYVFKHHHPEEKSLMSKLINKAYNTREAINNRIIDIVGKENGTLLGSFITGIRGRIRETDYNTMTNAGLAHIIAISGLNMAIVMGLVFIVIRRILVQSEYIALKFDTKKFAAIFAIIFGFLYLSITGFPVSANRAYLMSVLFFIGIILDREGDTMRFLALAAILILFNEPNLIFDAGFQLSFLAVISLIAGFKFLKEHGINTFTTNKLLKPFYYLFAILMSSVFAEIAVLPILIFSFNNYTPYNLITNMIAIPLSGFITLPFATFSILLFPFNLEKYLLLPASYSLSIILKLSEHIVSLPYSVQIVSSPPIASIVLMIFGFLWFALWEEKWRYFGILLFIIGIITSLFKEMPDVIIDKDDKFIILISDDKKLYSSSNKNKYKMSIIEKKFGQTYHSTLKDFCENKQNKNNCIHFINNVDYIFKNKDYLNNFIKLNNKYKIFDREYNILIN